MHRRRRARRAIQEREKRRWRNTRNTGFVRALVASPPLVLPKHLDGSLFPGLSLPVTPQPPKARAFHLGDVLSITTGRLLAPAGFGAVHDLVSYMIGQVANDSACIAMRSTCAAALIKQHPPLCDARPALSISGAELDAWMADQIRTMGEYLDVLPLESRR